MIGALLKLGGGLVDGFNKVMDYFRDKKLREDGQNEQKVADLSANQEQVNNEAIIRDRNAALGHVALVDKLRKQTGVDP